MKAKELTVAVDLGTGGSARRDDVDVRLQRGIRAHQRGVPDMRPQARKKPRPDGFPSARPIARTSP